MSEKLNVEWNDHQSVWRRSLLELRSNDDFADVTLVTEDKMKFTAHKILLSSCSKTLKFILKDNFHPNPLLYLSGINSNNLGLILDYIYCGEVKLLQEQLNGFLESAKKLEIEGLFGLEQDITHSDEQKNNDPLEDFQQVPDSPLSPSSPDKDEQVKEPEDEKHEVKMECSTSTKSRRQNFRGPLNAVFNASLLTAEEVEMKRKELYQKDDKVWICLVCDYDTKDGSNIKKHVEKHIGGLSYPCTLCSKEFKARVTFYRHMHKAHT